MLQAGRRLSFDGPERPASRAPGHPRRLAVKWFLTAATALSLLGGTAYAQTTADATPRHHATPATSLAGGNAGGGRSGNTVSSSNSNAVASNRATSQASSASTLSSSNSTAVIVNNGTAGDSSSSSASSGDPVIHYSGGYTVRNTPEVMPPPVAGGNPCAVGASAGISLPGFGIAGGGTWADKACERRQQAALLFNMGEPKVAYELMCQDDKVRSAMKIAGKPCGGDIAVAAAPDPGRLTIASSVAAPVIAPAAVPAPVVHASALPPPAPRPEWCSRAKPETDASKAYVAQACGSL
jgi:hypothetical protein